MGFWGRAAGLALGCVTVAAALADEAPSPFIDLSAYPGLVNAEGVVAGLQVELKYSTPDNFMGRDVYGDFNTCYLQKDAADMLAAAGLHLAAVRPDLRLHAYDCLRPRRVQRQMWKVVAGTPQQRYVANPTGPTGSIHNHGCAVDLTLATADGAALDMGTPFDFFGPEAHTTAEPSLLAQGKLTHAQLANRLLLREVMIRAGFYPLNSEWWHFNCARPEETRARYPLVE